MVQQLEYSIIESIETLKKQFDVLHVHEFGEWNASNYTLRQSELDSLCRRLWQSNYLDQERLVFVYDHDVFVEHNALGVILSNLQKTVNKVDISNFFVVILTTKDISQEELHELEKISTDPVSMNFVRCKGDFARTYSATPLTARREIYQYGSADPIKVSLSELTERQRFLLAESKYFCMYPWIHLHAFPNGDAYPCCHSDMKCKVGNIKHNTLEKIWNEAPMKQLRQNMLAERPSDACIKCYEQEVSGFFSGRQSANKHHGHHIVDTDLTDSQGYHPEFQMVYWDIRFSNLCNLSCRSCGHIFSSSWYQDQAKLAGPEWKKQNKPLLYAGRHETDVWEQLIEHIDYVEQIYFAGGEPLMMDEHYRILEELERREKFDVRLIYNTNFTQTKLKDRYVFDYWKKFDSVAVGASLDAMGPRAEYIRKGTDWAVVEDNRRRMLDTCPNVDFYISPTLSILNAWHLPDFHRDWVEKGFLKPQDLNVNILQNPECYRIDVAPLHYKQQLRARFEEHLAWLRPYDRLNRATAGFESAINFMMATDNSHLIPGFWDRTLKLDDIRAESLLDIIPELAVLGVQ